MFLMCFVNKTIKTLVFIDLYMFSTYFVKQNINLWFALKNNVFVRTRTVRAPYSHRTRTVLAPYSHRTRTDGWDFKEFVRFMMFLYVFKKKFKNIKKHWFYMKIIGKSLKTWKWMVLHENHKISMIIMKMHGFTLKSMVLHGNQCFCMEINGFV